MDQMILEILEFRPNLTLGELRRAVKEIDEDQLKNTLSNYTYRKYEPAEIGLCLYYIQFFRKVCNQHDLNPYRMPLHN